MQRYFSGVTDVALGIGAIGIAIAVLLNLGQIAFRYVLSDPLAWSEEVMRYLLIWVMMLSVASALYRSQEVTAGMLDWVASDVFQKCLHAVRVLFVFFFAVVLVGFGIPFAVGAGTQISPSAHPHVLALSRILRRRDRDPGGSNWHDCCAASARRRTRHQAGRRPMISLASSFFLFLAIGVPVAIAILIASMIGLVVLDFPLRGVLPRSLPATNASALTIEISRIVPPRLIQFSKSDPIFSAPGTDMRSSWPPRCSRGYLGPQSAMPRHWARSSSVRCARKATRRSTLQALLPRPLCWGRPFRRPS